jgi:hypothetical protein
MTSVITGRMRKMIKFTFTVSEDEFSEAIIYELQKHYVDQVTNWSWEPDASNLQDSLLTVIEFYMIPDDYAAWYETVKDL